MFRHIREALGYLQAIDSNIEGKTFVIKIGRDVMARAEEFGIAHNIGQLCAVGIQAVIVHAVRAFQPAHWPSLKIKAVKCGRNNREGMARIFREKAIPFVYCGQGREAQGDKMAATLAIKLRAAKLIFITDSDVISANGQIIHQMPGAEAVELLSAPNLVQGHMRDKLESALLAHQNGVPRVHIINGTQEDALLGEILTSEGVGTMIYEVYTGLRSAHLSERIEITEILRSTEFPVAIDSRQVVRNASRFRVRLYDDTVHGCILLTYHENECALELSYLGTSRIYEDSPDAELLLSDAIRIGRQHRFRHVFMETDKAQIWLGIYPWFLRWGFRRTSLGEVLPAALSGRDASTEVWYTTIE